MKTDNELIAEFMGFFAFETSIQGFSIYKLLDSNGNPIHPYYGPFNQNTMRFDKSWDWIMPVVEKIESIYDDHHGYFTVHIHSNACDIQGTNLWKAIEPESIYGDVYMSDPNAIFNTKIESTYYNVVQFIKWYNGQKA